MTPNQSRRIGGIGASILLFIFAGIFMIAGGSQTHVPGGEEPSKVPGIIGVVLFVLAWWSCHKIPKKED